uniref:Secreted protein n=1 Tax=Ascaris lumbricoides TaxID=6252 RepID=A0A0M3HLL9_ASCLU
MQRVNLLLFKKLILIGGIFKRKHFTITHLEVFKHSCVVHKVGEFFRWWKFTVGSHFFRCIDDR